MSCLLEVENLQVCFDTFAGEVHALRGVSLHVDKGETLAVVGESGCGKTVTAQSVMRLVPSPPGRFKGGSIRFNGREITALTEREMQSVRGEEIGMIFQDPMTSLNPTMTVGRQISEGLIKHHGMNKQEALKRSIELLEMVEIPHAGQRVNSYPHQFSGGMRQRVMAAIALACRPQLLFADEPTTALDVTIQAQILELLLDLQKKTDTAIVLITHDMGVVAKMARRINVMYAGKVVEAGTAEQIFYEPRHPYTWSLLKSIPRMDREVDRLLSIPGTPPDLFNPPPGCAFASRCRHSMSICFEAGPGEHRFNEEHGVFCWLYHPLAGAVRRQVAAAEGRSL
ncbi:MAG TPA: ABC transporter ATP-binding protein [Firmicutes bacterium]|nr:ABC transporter ATP-binding protein [Bacillota bacterium]